MPLETSNLRAPSRGGIQLPQGRVLERAKQRGELDADVRALASILGGITHTLAVRARSGEGRTRLRRVAAVALVTA